MNNKIILMFVLVLLAGNVNADPFATIAATGLSFVSPAISNAVNTALCVTNPLLCLEGRVVGYVTGQAFQAIQQISPEAAKAITTYNQVKGYIDEGAKILEEITLDEEGIPEKGEIRDVAKNGQEIGDLLGLEKEDAYSKKVRLKFNREEGYNNVLFEDDNGEFRIENKKKERYVFKNIKNGFITLDLEGNIVNADFTVGYKEQKTIYAFTQDVDYTLSSGQRITYNDGKVTVYKNKEELDPINTIDITAPGSPANSISILGDYIEIEGNKIKGDHFIMFKNWEFKGLNDGLAEITVDFTYNSLIEIEKGTHATESYPGIKIDYNVYGNDLNVNPRHHGRPNYFYITGSEGYTIISALGSGFSVDFSSSPSSSLRRKLKIEMIEDADLNIRLPGYLEPMFYPGRFDDLEGYLSVIGKGDFNLINGNYKISSQDGKVYIKLNEHEEKFDSISSSIIINTKKYYMFPIEERFEIKKDKNKNGGNIETLNSLNNPGITLTYINEGVSASGQNLNQEQNSFTILFKRARHFYKGQEYNVGKDLKGPLDADFYDRFVKESAKYNIDPYWASAITVAEYAGIRTANYKPNFNGYVIERGYLPHGFNIKDFKNPVYKKMLDDNFIKAGLDPDKLDLNVDLKKNFVEDTILSYKYAGSKGQIRSYSDLDSPLNLISFTSGQVFQEQALDRYKSELKRGRRNEDALIVALQAYQGYGYLDGEDKSGRYPHIKASEFPVYGRDLKEFMLALYKDKKFNDMVKKYNSKTPLMDKILNSENLASK